MNTMREHSIAVTWGTTSAERAMTFPCDALLPEADAAYFRAVGVDAPVSVLFRWLCQLRVAPYSYDRLDNCGRRSPRQLTPGMEHLTIGQRFMTIFTLADFAQDRHITLRMTMPGATARFGDIVVSYVVIPHDDTHCRLVAKLLVRYPRKSAFALMRWFLPWGDLVMMRKQLLTLKRLAETPFADQKG